MWRIFGCFFILFAGTPARAAEVLPSRLLAYAGLDAAFDGGFLSVGLDGSIGHGLDARGFVVRATYGVGRARWRSFVPDPEWADEASRAIRVMVGWREVGNWGQATLFAGLAHESRLVHNERIDRVGPLGSRAGPAIAFDAWLTPAPKWAIAIHATATTAMNAASLRFAPGYEVASGVHVGPEVIWSRHHGTERWRFGGFVSGLTLATFGFRLSAGYAMDRNGKSGPYAGIVAWRRLSPFDH